MNKIKVDKAVQIQYRFIGKVEDYALAWLHLTNNAREYPNVFLKHWNNSGNVVTVVTPKSAVDDMKHYLNGLSFGDFRTEFFYETEVTTVTPVIDWDTVAVKPGITWDDLDYAVILDAEDI